MATVTQTFGLHERFAEPQVLPPPPVRHALLVFLVTLTLILHIGTAGWSEIHNGAEGFYAGSAREMLAAGSFVPRNAGQALPNEPPLLHWLLVGSYTAFGVTPAAARVPIALAFVASVALTFLIGERLGGYWRGFIAGMIYLCSCGGYTWARFVTPDAVLAAIVAGAILCAVAGYQRRPSRRFWFAGFALCSGAAYLTGGAYALFFLFVVLAVPALCFREARMRFRALFHWSAIVAFLAVVTPWLVLLHHAPGALLNGVWFSPFAESAIGGQVSDTPLPVLLGAHLVWWFPALLLIIPGVLLAWRKVFRPHEIEFADLLPLWWVIAGFVMLMISGGHSSTSMLMWSGFALAVASAWDRISRTLRLAGIALVAVVGITAVAAIAATQFALPDVARAAFELGDRTFLTFVGAALAVCCGAAAYLVWHEREKLAITTLLLAMVPIGLGAAESIARNSPYLSFARVAPFLRSQTAPAAEVLFEGAAEAGSSLEFYLEGKYRVVQDDDAGQHVAAARQVFTSEQALQRMAKPGPLYLIIHKDRVPWWQAQLTERFHIYHQAASCGMHVVVSNHQ